MKLVKQIILLGVLSFLLYSFSYGQVSVILGRPTDQSITASILMDKDGEFSYQLGSQSGVYDFTSSVLKNVQANVPQKVDFQNLKANTKYYYRIKYRNVGQSSDSFSPEYTFYTQRAKGNPFVFTIEADEHLYDKKGVRSVYEICLDNQVKDRPDFMFSLGDTFGDDHTPDLTTSDDMKALHFDYIQYLKKICHSVPFFFCVGNHEGENGYYLKQNPPNNIAVYGTLWRKYYYANPFPNGFYTGNMKSEGYGIGLPENYYAFTWGDVQFIVLDVYRDCDINEKPQKWDWTLGEAQYQWFKKTLEESSSKFKFVFAHHTRGQGRGGVATASGYEWGGYNATKWEFDKYRPGWELPIHQLMVKHKVNIFFQGHDHLFAHEVLDGVTYQECPMPSDSTYRIGMNDNGDAYLTDTIEGAGHLRVSVESQCVTVDFVRAYLPKDTLGIHKNREVAFSYKVCSSTPTIDLNEQSEVNIYPNPSQDKIHITFQNPPTIFKAVLLNQLGQQVLQTDDTELNVSHLSRGVYYLLIETPQNRISKKISIQ